MSTDKKLSKAQIKKLIREGSALGSKLARFLPKLIKPAISLGKKHFSTSWSTCSYMSATDAAIQNKVHGYETKTVKFSNKDLDDMTKIVKALEDFDV